jgi:hypothetical protein
MGVIQLLTHAGYANRQTVHSTYWEHTMRYINYIFLVGAVVLFFAGLYFWLAQGQIDDAAFFFALAAIGHSTYLHATKSDKAGPST